MPEETLLVTRQARRSFSVGYFLVSLLLLGLPFLGRQKITISNERIVVEFGFWTKVRETVEIFRIKEVTSSQTFWQRLLGVGDVVIKAVEGRGTLEQIMVLKGIPDPVGVSETIRGVWNRTARPQGPATSVD